MQPAQHAVEVCLHARTINQRRTNNNHLKPCLGSQRPQPFFGLIFGYAIWVYSLRHVIGAIGMPRQGLLTIDLDRADEDETTYASLHCLASQPQSALNVDLTKLGKRVNRSEERRVGKECRSRWSPY